MIRMLPRSLFVLVLALALCLGATSGVRAAERPQEISALALETLFQEAMGAGDVKPIFADLGNGFHSMEIPLSDEAIASLEAAAQTDLETGKAQPPKLQVLATGVQVSQPTSTSTLIHAALSNKTLAYNHWIVVVNVGPTVTKKTTFALSGPKKFNRVAQVTYNASTIFAIWYNPGAGVNTTGIYTFKGTVDGGGNTTSKYYAQ